MFNHSDNSRMLITIDTYPSARHSLNGRSVDRVRGSEMEASLASKLPTLLSASRYRYILIRNALPHQWRRHKLATRLGYLPSLLSSHMVLPPFRTRMKFLKLISYPPAILSIRAGLGGWWHLSEPNQIDSNWFEFWWRRRRRREWGKNRRNRDSYL